MALIKCAECQQTVSDKAASCPHFEDDGSRLPHLGEPAANYHIAQRTSNSRRASLDLGVSERSQGAISANAEFACRGRFRLDRHLDQQRR